MNTSKPKVIQDYAKISKEMKEQIKLAYPDGFSEKLIVFFDKTGKQVSVLPFETEEKYYMIRMTEKMAVDIIEQDDDYDSDGVLKNEVKEEYETKYAEPDFEEEDDDVDSFKDDGDDAYDDGDDEDDDD